MRIKEIYFAGGCFWGTQHFLKKIPGVIETKTGYANSDVANPSYEAVYSETTNAAETVMVKYDENIRSIERLIELFFMTIDPTSLNRQGADEGRRYRTGIYYLNDEDGARIEKKVRELAASYEKPVVVEIKKLENFYEAEKYHQNYLDDNSGGYCHINPALFKIASEG